MTFGKLAVAVAVIVAGGLPGQTRAPNLRFTVASVKHSDPNRQGFGKPLTYTPGHYSGEGVSLATLAWHAWDIKEAYQLEWSSSWMASERYDIAASVPDGATIGEVRMMLQQLLTERFGLIVHRET